MLDITRWKASVKAVASLHLNGGHRDVVRGVVKQLNILFNTQLAMSVGLEHVVAVLEAVTAQVGATHDHHGDNLAVSVIDRLSYIEQQLVAFELQ